MSTLQIFRSVNNRACSCILFYQTVHRLQRNTCTAAASLKAVSEAAGCRKCRTVDGWQLRATSSVVDQQAPSAAEPTATEPALVTKLDLRVGRIISLEPHPEADTLYVEQVDVGEESPRTIISGLVKYVPADQLEGRSVVVVCNLKPRKMRGIVSDGMLLCASNAEHTQVEPLLPPEGAQPGQRIHFGEGDGSDQPDPMTPNQVQKKKLFENVQPDLKTNADGVAAWKDQLMQTPQGPILAPSLTKANIA